MPADDLVAHFADDPSVAQLRGYAALLYTGAAAIVTKFTRLGLTKAHAAVLARHGMPVILAALPPEVRDYLATDEPHIQEAFERSIRARIPDLDELAHEIGRPEYRNIFDTESYASGAYYLGEGLNPVAPTAPPTAFFGVMSVLPHLDTYHAPDTGNPLAVVEVRSYGARHVSAGEAERQHGTLAGLVRQLEADVWRRADPSGSRAFLDSLRSSAATLGAVESPLANDIRFILEIARDSHFASGRRVLQARDVMEVLPRLARLQDWLPDRRMSEAIGRIRQGLLTAGGRAVAVAAADDVLSELGKLEIPGWRRRTSRRGSRP